MLLFIEQYENILESDAVFKYILCYCLSIVSLVFSITD